MTRRSRPRRAARRPANRPATPPPQPATPEQEVFPVTALPEPSQIVIMPDDLADERYNHAAAWGGQHVFERGKQGAERNRFYCQAPGCDTTLVISSEASNWGQIS